MRSTGAEGPQPWYESQPERLQWELAQFAARELPATKHFGLADGRFQDDLVIRTQLPFDGRRILVEVLFPFEYPDQPPTVFGPRGLLQRHQQPRDGNFCWSEDSDREWWPGADAAHLVAEDVRWLLEDTEAGDDVVHAAEADMPEPVTGFMTLSPRDVVVVPAPYFHKELPGSSGSMTLIGSRDRLFMAQAANLGVPDPELKDRYFKDQPELAGYWVELRPTPTAEVFESTDALLSTVDAADPRAFERLARRLKESKSLQVAACWLGMTFLEEGPLRGELRRNWVFAGISLERSSGERKMTTKVGAQALTVEERKRRTPELVGLGGAHILVVGAGSLGSPVVFELAKAGVGVTDVVDSDRMDVNNSVRHMLSPRWAGSNKGVVTATQAGEMNPFVEVRPHAFSVGLGPEEAKRLQSLVAEAHVVLDTTGSNSVARILQRYCREAGKPLVAAGLSAGSFGGDIAVFEPGGACFECFALSQRDGIVPEPSAAPPSSLVTPVGCSHPAFAGAGFEATHLAAVAARTVVQVTGLSKYPVRDFDWAVMNFRSDPRWSAGRLAKHPECGRCS